MTCVPNVAHGDLRIALLQGKFRYAESGLLDETHLRFFTLETLRELLGQAGLVIVDTKRVVVQLFHWELGVNRGDVDHQTLDALHADPELECYQYVMRSVRDNGDHAVTDLAARVDELTDRLHDQRMRLALLRGGRGDINRGDVNREDVNEYEQYIEALEGHVSGLKHNIEVLNAALIARNAEYQAVLGMRTVQITAPICWVYNRTRAPPRRRPERSSSMSVPCVKGVEGPRKFFRSSPSTCLSSTTSPRTTLGMIGASPSGAWWRAAIPSTPGTGNRCFPVQSSGFYDAARSGDPVSPDAARQGARDHGLPLLPLLVRRASNAWEALSRGAQVWAAGFSVRPLLGQREWYRRWQASNDEMLLEQEFQRRGRHRSHTVADQVLPGPAVHSHRGSAASRGLPAWSSPESDSDRGFVVSRVRRRWTGASLARDVRDRRCLDGPGPTRL